MLKAVFHNIVQMTLRNVDCFSLGEYASDVTWVLFFIGKVVAVCFIYIVHLYYAKSILCSTQNKETRWTYPQQDQTLKLLLKVINECVIQLQQKFEERLFSRIQNDAIKFLGGWTNLDSNQANDFIVELVFLNSLRYYALITHTPPPPLIRTHLLRRHSVTCLYLVWHGIQENQVKGQIIVPKI